MDKETQKLRDQFAIAALAGGLEQGLRDNFDTHYWHGADLVANRAYEIADAMLRARK